MRRRIWRICVSIILVGAVFGEGAGEKREGVVIRIDWCMVFFCFFCGRNSMGLVGQVCLLVYEYWDIGHCFGVEGSV